LLSDKKKQS